MKVRTIFLVRHRLWQSPTLHPPSPSRPFLVFWTTCQEREAFLVKFAVSGVFTFGALFSYNTTNNSIHTLAFSSTLFVFVIIHIFHYCICYYFYGLLFVFFTIVFVIICICYYLYWLLFVLFTSRPTSSSPPASSLPPSSPQYGGLPRKPGRQKHLLQMPG